MNCQAIVRDEHAHHIVDTRALRVGRRERKQAMGARGRPGIDGLTEINGAASAPWQAENRQNR